MASNVSIAQFVRRKQDGGGRGNGASVLECISKIEALLGRKMNWKYVDENRKGDHICYMSDLRKFQSHYPEWKLTRSLDNIIERMVKGA